MVLNKEAYHQIVEECKEANAELIAVSKLQPNHKLETLYEMGHLQFGENRVNHLLPKIELFPEDIRWHFIGHLQSNKVKAIIGKVALIHSIDSEKLLQTVQTKAATQDLIQPILLQIHVAQELHKFGWDIQELDEFLKQFKSKDYPNIRIKGVMSMATFTKNEVQIAEEFRESRKIFEQLQSTFTNEFDICCMGMSGDYQIALQEGSNMIRVGGAIFGQRDYV